MTPLSQLTFRRSTYCQGPEGVCVETGFDPDTSEVVILDSKDRTQGALRFLIQRYELFWNAVRRGEFEVYKLSSERRTADPSLGDGLAVRLIEGPVAYIGVSELAQPDGLELQFFLSEWQVYLDGICVYNDHKPSRMLREPHPKAVTVI